MKFQVLSRAVLLCALATIHANAIGQDSTKQDSNRSAYPSTTIITSVPFNGVRYFIKIAPLPAGNIDHMPISNPEAGRTILWGDSLNRLLPDTVLRLLVPKPGDILRLNPRSKQGISKPEKE